MPVEDEVERVVRARIGNVVRGKYTLERVLGVGGMGAVYVATHRNRKQFAIKMLHPELSQRESIRSRFLREGYVANSVGHPGAVAVLDDDIAEDGSAFLVMELLQGAPVDALATNNGGRLGPATVMSMASQLLEVLAVAHANGIVHRDLKPANLFLSTEGRLKVLDFGIARLREAGAAVGLGTQTGAMLGTPAYMAPEQAIANANEIDAQTDLWAVGATMFELLTGQLVHVGANAQQLLIAAGTRAARPLRTVAPEVSVAVAEVVDKALSFEKRDRWANALEMGGAVKRAQETFGVVITSSSELKALHAEGEIGQLLSLPARGVATPSALGPTWDVARGTGTPVAPSVPAASAIPPSTGSSPKATTTSGLAETRPPASAAGGSKRWPVMIPAGLGVVALLAFGLSSRHPGDAADLATRIPAVAVAVDAGPTDRDPNATASGAPAAATPSASASGPALVATSVTSGRTTPPSPPISHAVAHAASPKAAQAAAGAGAAKPKPDCVPPYTLDANGIKHAKLECL